MRWFIALVCAGLAAGSGHAAVIVSIQETGGNVTANLSGSLNTAGLSNTGATITASANQAYVFPINGIVLFVPAGGGSGVFYEVPNTLAFGTGGLTYATSSTGSLFGVNSGLFNTIALPDGYTSGAPLSGTLTFAGASFSSLGLTPGTYNLDVSSGATADTITIQIGAAAPAPIPEPASLVAFAALVGLGGFAMRRRVAATSRA